MDGVNLEKAGFPLVPGVMGADGDMLFQEITRFGAADAPGGELFPVLFQGPVDGSGAYPQELGP
jgi:hypothetical protein